MKKNIATRRNHLPRPADNPPMIPGSTRPRRPRTLSAAEALLWSHLRAQGLEGWRFSLRTPHPPTARLTPSSALTPASPCRSTATPTRMPATTPTPARLRFTSFEVLVATEAVLQAILLALRTALTRRRTN